MEAKPRVVRLGRKQYRAFFEVVKRETGAVLAVMSAAEMGGCWGMYNPMAVPVQIDAKDPNSMFAEKAAITLADRINVRRLKSAKRPEMDWHSVPDDKVYEFVLWHEIGHRMNNFYIPDVWRAVDGLERGGMELFGRAKRANEVLADRYAWGRLFPDRRFPVRGDLPREQCRELSRDIEHISTLVELREIRPPALPLGQYDYVPLSMLKSDRLAAYVGPDAAMREVTA